MSRHRTPQGPPTPTQMAWHIGLLTGSWLPFLVLFCFRPISEAMMYAGFLIGLSMAVAATWMMNRSFFLRLVAGFTAFCYLMLIVVPSS